MVNLLHLLDLIDDSSYTSWKGWIYFSHDRNFTITKEIHSSDDLGFQYEILDI